MGGFKKVSETNWHVPVRFCVKRLGAAKVAETLVQLGPQLSWFIQTNVDPSFRSRMFPFPGFHFWCGAGKRKWGRCRTSSSPAVDEDCTGRLGPVSWTSYPPSPTFLSHPRAPIALISDANVRIRHQNRPQGPHLDQTLDPFLLPVCGHLQNANSTKAAVLSGVNILYLLIPN